MGTMNRVCGYTSCFSFAVVVILRKRKEGTEGDFFATGKPFKVFVFFP